MNNCFAIDTNILVYAHDKDNPYHKSMKDFLVATIKNNPQSLCIPYQVLLEFIHAITKRVKKPLSIEQAILLVKYYQSLDIQIIYPKPTQLETLLTIFKQTPFKNRLFDIAIIATLKDNNIRGIYTVNTKDFIGYDFLSVINPINTQTHQPPN